jgi:hypothetical protein
MEGEEAPAVNLGGRMRTTESYCARGARLVQPPMPIGEVKWMHTRGVVSVQNDLVGPPSCKFATVRAARGGTASQRVFNFLGVLFTGCIKQGT